MCNDIALFILFATVGIYIPALLILVVVKPVRRLFRERRLVSATVLVLSPALVFCCLYSGAAYLDAFFDVFNANCCCDTAQLTRVDCIPELADPDFARELCLRNLIPPFAEETCYTDEEAICSRLDLFFSRAAVESRWRDDALFAAAFALLSELPLLMLARRGKTPEPDSSTESPR